jgi:hypothetical protein
MERFAAANPTILEKSRGRHPGQGYGYCREYRDYFLNI